MKLFKTRYRITKALAPTNDIETECPYITFYIVEERPFFCPFWMPVYSFTDRQKAETFFNTCIDYRDNPQKAVIMES